MSNVKVDENILRNIVVKAENYSVDYPKIIAAHSSRLLAGNGVTLSHDKTEWLDNFLQKNELSKLINQLCFALSLNGEMILGFDVLANKDVRLYLAKPGLTKIIKEYNEIVGAVVWKEVYTSNVAIYYTREKWTNQTIERQFFYSATKDINPGEGKQINFHELKIQIPKEHILPEKETNTWNIIPFVDFENLANVGDKKDVLTTNTIPKTINRLRKMMVMEAQKNQTRVFGLFSNKTDAATMKKNLEQGKFNDFIIQYTPRNEKGALSLETITGNPQLQIWQETIERMEKQLFTYCGYSYNAVIEGVSATEIAISNSVDAKTTNLKRELITTKMTKLFEILSKVLGWKNTFRFSLNDNVNIDRNQELELILKEKQADMISRVEAIAKYRNITLAEAQKIADEIDKDYDAERDRYQSLTQTGQENLSNDITPKDEKQGAGALQDVVSKEKGE